MLQIQTLKKIPTLSEYYNATISFKNVIEDIKVNNSENA